MSYTNETLEKAIADVVTNGIKPMIAAKKYNIPRSTMYEQVKFFLGSFDAPKSSRDDKYREKFSNLRKTLFNKE